MTSAERIGANIRVWRTNRRLTQVELGALIGSDGPRVGRLEKGSENPTVETLDKLASALGIDVHALTVPRPEDPGHAGEVGGDAIGVGVDPVIEGVREQMLALLDREDSAPDSIEGDVLKAHAILTRAVQRLGRQAAARRAAGGDES
jgi:transcriptional regulator with XRE-family HTH domain